MILVEISTQQSARELDVLWRQTLFFRLCKKKYVTKISSKKGFAIFNFENENFEVDIRELLKIYKNKIRFSPGLKPTITLALGYNEDIKALKEIKEFLRNL